MTILVFCAVLIAALLHTSWNALVKTGGNKQTGMLLLTLARAFFGLCLIPFVPMPKGEVWVWLLFSALFYTTVILAFRGRSVLPQHAKQISVGILAGFASFIAYAIVVLAMTEAPIFLVTALRKSSILLAMILGWFFFRDRMDLTKILSGIVIVTGVVLTRF